MYMLIGLIPLIQDELHEPEYGHPENSARMKIPLDFLLASDLKADLKILKPEEVKISDILHRIHNPNYLRQVETVADSGGGFLDGDTYVTPGTYRAALGTAAAAVWAVREILTGKEKRIFLAGRPPGHHAEQNFGMGFCIINNTAVAAETAIVEFGLKRVAIIDWDVHHGNGTQHTFYGRDDVLFVSLHRFPFYPGSGASAEKGEGKGRNYTLNIPLPAGSDDEIYLGEFTKRVTPRLIEYRPELIIITSGFDAHTEDPLGGMRVTAEGFGLMTNRLVSLANEYCEGKIFSLFEGGYSPQGNTVSLYQHIKELQKD